VAALFSTGRDEAADAAARLQEENKQLQRRLRVVEEVAARGEARELVEEADAAATGGGLRIVARVFEGRDVDDLRRMATALATHAGTIALLGSRDAGAARLVFARAADAAGDMNALMREACQALEGRGGGRADMAQGGGPRAEKLPDVIEEAARKVRG
jgi:alanyl-tRNA synthetase